MLHGWVHTILCISLLLGTACATEKNLAKPEMEKLQGTWQLVYQQINGKKLPDEKTAEMLHGKMVFTGNKIHYTVELQGFDFEFTYRLHPDQEPKAIDLHLTGQPRLFTFSPGAAGRSYSRGAAGYCRRI